MLRAQNRGGLFLWLLAAFGEHFEPFLGYRKRKKPCKYTLQGFAIICFDILRYGRDSNPRPPAWQAGILTSWTTAPGLWDAAAIAVLRVQRYGTFLDCASVLQKKCEKSRFFLMTGRKTRELRGTGGNARIGFTGFIDAHMRKSIPSTLIGQGDWFVPEVGLEPTQPVMAKGF